VQWNAVLVDEGVVDADVGVVLAEAAVEVFAFRRGQAIGF
jgi:hypothetical protein